VPSTLADLGVGGAALWIVPPVPKALVEADSASIVKVATLTATSFCDTDFVVGDREANLRYIALNSVDHPASMVLRESKIWIPYRRQISLPDMVAVRKADFVKLFTTLGVPLEARELNVSAGKSLLPALQTCAAIFWRGIATLFFARVVPKKC